MEYSGAERKEESRAASCKAWGTDRYSGIEKISRDMWPAFLNSCRALVPGATDKMVFARFPIMQHVSRGVDRVRMQEHKALPAQGDATWRGAIYLWLDNGGNMPEAAHARLNQIKRETLKTGRAWALKESWRDLGSSRSPGWAKRVGQRWYHGATHRRLPAMIEAAQLLARHVPNEVTSFKHRITSAVAEGLHATRATRPKRAYGVSTRAHFKIAVYFHCGGLLLYPVQMTHRKV